MIAGHAQLERLDRMGPGKPLTQTPEKRKGGDQDNFRKKIERREIDVNHPGSPGEHAPGVWAFRTARRVRDGPLRPIMSVQYDLR